MKCALDRNENAWGPPPAVVRAVRAIGAEAIRTYPDAGPAAGRVARALGVAPGALRLTNGADEAIQAVCEAVLEPGDEVLLPVPTFSFYHEAAGRRRARVREVPFREGFRFPLAGVLRAFNRRPRLAVVVSPNNPTGTRLGRADLLRLLDRAGRAVVLLDETYAPFAGRSSARLVRSRPNLAVVGSFSKFQGMAGLRLGYVAAGPGLLARIERALPPYSVNAAALAAAEAVLNADAYLNRMNGEIDAERRRLAAGLRRLGLRVFSGAANFLLVDVGAGCAGLCAGLRASGVFVKDLSCEPHLAGYFRVAVGRPRQDDFVLKTLADSLPPEALLFDLDGVLVDVSRSYDRAIARTVEILSGRPAQAEEIRALRLRTGFNDDGNLTAALLRRRGLRLARREIMRVFRPVYFGCGGDGLILEERALVAKDVLARLSRRRPLGIVTGRPRLEAFVTLRRLGLDGFFATVVAREAAAGRLKPDPYGIRLAMKRLGVRRAAYIGDIPDDMRAARSAGALAVAVLSGPRSGRPRWEARMRRAGARIVLDRIEDCEEAVL